MHNNRKTISNTYTLASLQMDHATLKKELAPLQRTAINRIVSAGRIAEIKAEKCRIKRKIAALTAQSEPHLVATSIQPQLSQASQHFTVARAG